jgi:GNAT superfamily N-acetyltransferase
MNQDDLRAVAHQALALAPAPWLRHQRQGKHELREGVALTAQDFPGPGFNFAAVLGPTPPLARVLELAAAFFAGHAGGYGILVEGDAGHPVESELRARGWPVAEDEPALVMPAVPAVPAPPAGLAVRRVTDEHGLQEFCRTTNAIFQPPPELREKMTFPAAVAWDPALAFFLGHADGRVVGTAMVCCVGPTAVVAGIATVPECRGRGFGTALTWAAVREGAERGCTSAALRSGPMSFRLYQRMGFVPVCSHRTYAVPEQP